MWLGDHDATEYRGAVLDVTRIAKGERYGYRQEKAAADGHLVVVAGGTSHGVGLEAPKALHGLMPRAKGVARAGLATVNRNLSPFVWAGKQRWFAEPPHMQVSILFLPSDVAPPAVGDELVAHLRHTTTQFDRVVDRLRACCTARAAARRASSAPRGAGRRAAAAAPACRGGSAVRGRGEHEDVLGAVQYPAGRVVVAVLPQRRRTAAAGCRAPPGRTGRACPAGARAIARW